MKVEIVIGLPGSGKDWLVDRKMEQDDYKDYLVFKDIGKKNYAGFKEALNKRLNLIVIDPYHCLPICRNECLRTIERTKPDEMECIFFSKDEVQCFRNTKSRPNLHKLIHTLSKYYQVPIGYRALPVYGGEGIGKVLKEAENSFLAEGETYLDIETIMDHYNPYIDKPIYQVLDRDLARFVDAEDRHFYIRKKG
jgi:hypothetical protein